MAESLLIGVVIGLIGGVVLTLLAVVAVRYARGSRELGTDGEHASHRTLHLASQAAVELRDGLTGESATRAARHLRALLGCEAVVIVADDGSAAGDAAGTPELATARKLAQRVAETGRSAVVPLESGTGAAGHAIAVPVLVDGVVVGSLVALASSRRAPLLRAATEAATWVAAQLRLGQLEASRAALAEAELKALRAQISPHFIYNALTAISSFITTDPATARELVLEFADFTRYSFRRQGDFTTLAEELRSIHSYLRLERARFGDRLQVTLQVAPETLSAVIPFLSVQPLVENSVRHGLESREGGGRITITAEEQGTEVSITVEDDGVGMEPDDAAELLAGRAGEHVGLRNVDARLRQVYGDGRGLVIETNVGSGMLVRVTVPRSQPLRDADALPVGQETGS